MKKNARSTGWAVLAAVGVGLGVAASPAGGQTVIFVDAAATGAGDGSSWDDAYTSVQPALNAATNGQQVWVAAGRYVGTITLADGVGLYGGFAGTEDPAMFDLADREFAAHETILDGNQAGSVVTGPAGATASTRIDGFTVTNGNGRVSGSHRYGGGLYLANSSPTIANDIVKGNIATYGGGLFMSTCAPTIANSVILNNSAGTGGGLCLQSCTATIVNAEIRGNDATGNGGGLSLTASSPIIANSTIMGNGASAGGGMLLSFSSPTIVNDTIVGNAAAYGDGGGGGLYMFSSSPTIVNNIIGFNSSGIYRSGTGGAPVLRHNCVYGNTAFDFSGVADPVGTGGNIAVDPKLADVAYGDAHIQPDSPGVDAGTNGWAYGDFDLDGQARIQPAGGAVDIGADETDGAAWPAGPYAVVRVSPDGDDGHDGSSWDLAKRTVQAGIDAASGRRGEVWVQAGTYDERIKLWPYAHVYGGFGGGEAERDGRDWRANVTTLDGQEQGAVVTVRAGHRVSAVDGFTITNGSGYPDGGDRFGGGLCLHYSAPTVANNTITGNSADSGGGLYANNSSPTVMGNTVAGNSASWDGGGLYLIESFGAIADNTITGNTATYYGGGLSLESSSPAITRNTIAGNNASELGGGLVLWGSSPTTANNTIAGNGAREGGGLYLLASSPSLANNLMTGNSAAEFGGALGVYGGSAPAIVNSTIAGNSAGEGGGLYLSTSSPMNESSTIPEDGDARGGGGGVGRSSPTMANTIVAFNSSGIFRAETGGALALRHNCVYGNTGYNYSGISDPTGTGGNISANPLFVLYPDDLQLLADSPGVEAGSNGLAVGELDLDGRPRIVDGDADGTAVVDMGAYEYDWTILPCDLDGDGDVDGADYAAFRAAFGRSVGQAGYDGRCDYDHSGRVGLSDYQAWLACYREFVGNPVAGPPQPGSGPTPGVAIGTSPVPVEDAGQVPSRGGTGRP